MKNKQIKGFLRFSHNQEINEEQRTIILKYCKRHGIKLDNKDSWYEFKFSNDSKIDFEKIKEYLEKELERDDTLIITELSSLSSSIANLSRIIKVLWEREINLISIKEQLKFSVKNPQLMSTFEFFSYINDLLKAFSSKAAGERYYRENYKNDSVNTLIPHLSFDPYKKEIVKLLKEGVDDLNVIKKTIGIGTTKGIENYIKSRNLKEEARGYEQE